MYIKLGLGTIKKIISYHDMYFVKAQLSLLFILCDHSLLLVNFQNLLSL